MVLWLACLPSSEVDRGFEPSSEVDREFEPSKEVDREFELSSEVDHGFEPQSGQTKDYKIGICCFSA